MQPKRPLFAVIATVLTLSVVPASAQQFGPARADLNQDGQITRAEATEAREKMFTRLDRNSDGQVSDEEMRSARGAVKATVQMADAMIVLRMRRMDTDGNGALTKAEFMADNPMFDRADRNGDGVVSAEEIAEIRAKIAARRQ